MTTKTKTQAQRAPAAKPVQEKPEAVQAAPTEESQPAVENFAGLKIDAGLYRRMMKLGDEAYWLRILEQHVEAVASRYGR